MTYTGPYGQDGNLDPSDFAWAAGNPRRELIDAVKAHAVAHYNDGGWDVVVECYDDDMILEVIGKARTPKGAIKKFRPLVSIWADRQADAINSAF